MHTTFPMNFRFLFCCFILSFQFAWAQQPATPFQAIDSLPQATPWTHLDFDNDPATFQFAIVSDRTGGHRDGVFEDAVHKLNMLRPEFVMSVGDFIEGYTKDQAILKAQWDEFYTILNPLRAPFFFLPGNHDISNDVMRAQWNEKHGVAYYAFTYRDVLFICLDSNDGDGVTISDEQVAYVQGVLTEHTDVRWTMLFMHHPIWDYQDLSGFQPIEEALQGRDYTVIAGHRHRYLYEARKNKDYITLASTGGGSPLRGPQFGEYDHVVWVTMAPEGPTLANIQLEGIFEPDFVNPLTKTYADNILKAAHPAIEVLTDDTEESGTIRLLYQNQSDLPIKLAAQLFHHHQLELPENSWDTEIPAGQPLTVSIPFKRLKQSASTVTLDPLQLQWRLHYASDSLSGFQLSGTETLTTEATAPITFSPGIDKFLEQQTIEIDYPFDDTTIRYTLDGSEPTASSPSYSSPITVNETTTIRAVVYEDDLQSESYEHTFEKVKPLQNERVRRPEQGLSYDYFEGEWKQLPDFATLTRQKQGTATDLDVEKIAGNREDHFAIRFQGYLKAPQEGMYTFRLQSDDGARIFIHDKLVIDNDGSHSSSRQQGFIALKKGYHPIEILYFEDFLGETLEIDWQLNTVQGASEFDTPDWYH
ncbi:MAG: PA14 domain-containing protein [Cyclobacteriaceae bacterium]